MTQNSARLLLFGLSVLSAIAPTRTRADGIDLDLEAAQYALEAPPTINQDDYLAVGAGTPTREIYSAATFRRVTDKQNRELAESRMVLATVQRIRKIANVALSDKDASTCDVCYRASIIEVESIFQKVLSALSHDTK